MLTIIANNLYNLYPLQQILIFNEREMLNKKEAISEATRAVIKDIETGADKRQQRSH